MRIGFLLVALARAASAQEDTAYNCNEQGMAASNRGQFREAQSLYERAIQIWRELGPRYEAHLATTEVNLAQSLSAMGEREAAVRNLFAAVAQFRHTLGPENLRTLTALNLLGANYLMLGDDGKAAGAFQEAFATEQRAYPETTEMARTLGGLAHLALHSGNVGEALPYSEEALRIVLKTDGDDTLDAALVYANLAEVYRIARHPERAAPLYRKAHAIYERILGPEHPRVASLFSQEALIFMEEGKYSLAEKNLRRSLDILDRSCPKCVFEHVVSETNLGVLRTRQHRYEEADQILSRVVSVEERNWQPGPLMAGTLRALSDVREKERRHDEAAKLQKRADLILSYR